MSEELTFSRKASGLTRGLNTYDAFGVGLFVILPTYVIWWLVMAGFGLFPGANLYITVAITAVFLAVPSAIVWGILGGSMPRSGGDYVYNTRVIIPLIGMVASMGMFLGQLYWNIYQATFITQPALQLIGQIMGWQGLVDFANSKSATFVCAVGVYAIAFCIVGFGMRYYKAVQRPLIVITLASTAICLIALLFTSKAVFVGDWNAAATNYHSLSYSAFVAAVEKANGGLFPTTWTWSATFAAMTASCLLVLYGYVSNYVGGEVKRPSKSIMTANFLAGMVTIALAILCLVALNHIADSRFLMATQYNVLNGPVKGYSFPWDTSLNGLVFMGSGFNRAIGLLWAVTWILTTITIFAAILLFMQRAIFAWGMDNMGPKWFAEISGRWTTPIKGYLFLAIISCAFTVVYILWLQSNLAGLVGTGMALVTIFLITGVSAIIIPYRKRVRHIWESSPYRTWKVLGVPIVTVAGVFYVAYILLLIYYAYFDSRTRDATGKNIFSFAAVWVFGVAWYFYWRRVAKRREVSTEAMFRELPPE